MADNLITVGHVLSDETCEVLCEAARQKSREIGVEISFAISDADGLPRLFRRFGNALVLSTVLVPKKAYTSAVTCTPTGDLIDAVSDGGNLMGMNTCDSRLTVVPGGLPLIVNGEIVGAIGVGGGTKEQDMEIALHIVETFNSLVR